MTEKRLTQTQTLQVLKCERCGESHQFLISIIIDRDMDVLGMSTITKKSYDLVLKCPKTDKTIIASVPVSLQVNDSLVNVRLNNG